MLQTTCDLLDGNGRQCTWTGQFYQFGKHQHTFQDMDCATADTDTHSSVHSAAKRRRVQIMTSADYGGKILSNNAPMVPNVKASTSTAARTNVEVRVRFTPTASHVFSQTWSGPCKPLPSHPISSLAFPPPSLFYPYLPCPPLSYPPFPYPHPNHPLLTGV